MTSDIVRIDRRSFLKIGATTAGGLLVGYYRGDSDVTASSQTFRPNGYVRIGEQRDFPSAADDATNFNATRLKQVLRLAVERSGYGAAMPRGQGRGIAVHFTFGSYCAQVADVSVDANKRLRVSRVVAVIDVGLPVDPLNLEAQTQSGIIDGLSAALFGEITIERGRTVQSTFENYPLLRNRDAPNIEVHIVPSRERPTGFGEIALPPIAPAVGNAIFAATGIRVRRLPIVKSGFRIS